MDKDYLNTWKITLFIMQDLLKLQKEWLQDHLDQQLLVEWILIKTLLWRMEEDSSLWLKEIEANKLLKLVRNMEDSISEVSEDQLLI